MDISFKSLEKIANSNNIKIINQYLTSKYKYKINIDKNKKNELNQLNEFFIKNIDIHNLNIISVFLIIFKYEHDAMLFFSKKQKIIIIDIEIKTNSSSEKAKLQIHEHLSFLGSRLDNTKYIIYGVSIIYDKLECKLYKYIAKSKKIINCKNSLKDFINNLLQSNWTQLLNSNSIIKNMGGDISETIKICEDKIIKLSSAEDTLMNWIDNNIKDNDILVIDANGGVGKTTMLFHLFFDKYLDKSEILINNYRIKNQIKSNYESKKWFEKIFFREDNINNINNFKILLVDEGQRLNLTQIIELSKKYEKLIIFGDQYQVFEDKYNCNYSNLPEILGELKIKSMYTKFCSDTNRRNSKDFPILIKNLLNDQKFKMPKKKINIGEKILIYDDWEDFYYSYSHQNLHKKMFAEINAQRNICSDSCISKNFNELNGSNNPGFALNADFNSIGTVYNAFSFEIDSVYIIISSNLEAFTSNRYLFNEIYTLATRVKKELHILLYKKDIKNYCELSKKIKRKNINYEK